jgi:hypothetical protein
MSRKERGARRGWRFVRGRNPQLGEWDGAVDAAEGIGDALVDGTWLWC